MRVCGVRRAIEHAELAILGREGPTDEWIYKLIGCREGSMTCLMNSCHCQGIAVSGHTVPAQRQRALYLEFVYCVCAAYSTAGWRSS